MDPGYFFFVEDFFVEVFFASGTYFLLCFLIIHFGIYAILQLFLCFNFRHRFSGPWIFAIDPPRPPGRAPKKNRLQTRNKIFNFWPFKQGQNLSIFQTFRVDFFWTTSQQKRYYEIIYLFPTDQQRLLLLI